MFAQPVAEVDVVRLFRCLSDGHVEHVCVFADDVELPPAELERWLK